MYILLLKYFYIIYYYNLYIFQIYPKYEFNINIYFYKVITQKKNVKSENVVTLFIDKVWRKLSNKLCQFIPKKTNNKF